MTTDPTPPTTLSPAGARRRDAMLDELVVAMTAHHHRRRVRRRLAGAALVAVVGVAAVLAGTARPSVPTETPPRIVEAPPAPSGPPAKAPACVIVRVGTEPGTAQRYTGDRGGGIEVERLDESTLLTTLAAIDRPSGIIEMDGRTEVVSR